MDSGQGRREPERAAARWALQPCTVQAREGEGLAHFPAQTERLTSGADAVAQMLSLAGIML